MERRIYVYYRHMRISQSTTMSRVAILALGGLLAASCAGAAGGELAAARAALAAAPIPAAAKASIRARIDESPKPFLASLAQALADRAADPMLLYRTDREKALPAGYAPTDLVGLDGTGLSVSRPGHKLREAAFRALKSMNAAALAEGVTLLVSSSYRSYDYQVEVWSRGVAAEGEAATDAGIARPGHSQHQLGEAVDFGSITDAFAETKAGRWLAANARRFGFSLSFPKGMSEATGYQWESWHYRYVGKAAAALEGSYFGGVQRYVLLFLEEMR
jgi:zinc D-Ala-D-Ala carboxypeptidase